MVTETSEASGSERPFSLKTLGSYVRRYPHRTISPVALVAIIGLWWLACHALGVPRYVFPSPQEVGEALLFGLGRWPTDPASYWFHIGVTVWEAHFGFLLGSLRCRARGRALPLAAL